MARGPAYRVPFRRRREGKTNYYCRKELIKSEKIRLVIRCSLSHTRVQFVKSEVKGDKVLISAFSKELKKYGWKAPYGNLPAAYLTGFLAGLKAKNSELKEAVIDAGIKKPSKGSRIYAGLKGIIDAGIYVPCDDRVFPSDDRVEGKHIAKYWKLIGSSEKRGIMFSQYLAKDLNPENLPEHFNEVKQKIKESFS